MNRRSKAVQMECQRMFLRLYFLTRVEEHDAIVYDIRSNGFLAYVPTFDFKGPVYLEKEGIVCLDPALLGLKRLDGLIDSGKENDENNYFRYDRRIKEFEDYECRLIRGEDNDKNDNNGNNNIKELLICPKEYNSDNNNNNGNNNGRSFRNKNDNILSILPLQRIRVAITSSSFSSSSNNNNNSNRTSCIRLTLIATDQYPFLNKRKDENQSNNLIEKVLEDGEKIIEKRNIPDILSYKDNIQIQSLKNILCNSLYLSIKGVKSQKKSQNHLENIKIHHDDVEKEKKNEKIKVNKKSNILNCRSRLLEETKSLKYELLGGGRVAYGLEEDIRLIFHINRNKSIENKKIQDRKKEIKDFNDNNNNLNERIDGDDLLMKIMSKEKNKNTKNINNSSINQIEINEETKTEILLDSLKDNKRAAMKKMLLYGEEWPEEEDLPTSWEAGNGGGADTELGKKASNGGFSKELSLASARQGKLRVAKKNSKYG